MDPVGQVLQHAHVGVVVAVLRTPVGGVVGEQCDLAYAGWMMGRQIDAQLIDGRTIAGKVVSLNDDASISVRTASGETERLSTGDIGLMV